MERGKMVPEKNGPREKWWSEKWSPENWSPEKFPSKIILRQKNARKFKQLFRFYQLMPLHTQKNVWRLRHDPTYVLNCRTLKESRKICCRVLGFHKLITSEHSTHTARCSTLTRFFVCIMQLLFLAIFGKYCIHHILCRHNKIFTILQQY